MALTPTEEAQLRLLIAQESELLSLASNEPTIISKLGATKVTLSDLNAAGSIADADLFLIRQGTTDKKATASTLFSYLNGKFTTPPQFDNDTSPATTEFVQRALGNFQTSVLLGVGATTNVVAADMGKHFKARGGTVNLPALSTVIAGTAILITFSSTTTVARNGTDNIIMGGSTNTSLSGKDGDYLIVIAQSSSAWEAYGSLSGNKGLNLLQAYTTAGTNTPTVPTGVYRIYYKVWGGGGGGGGGSSVAAAGNGGGSGGYCEGWMAVTPGQTLTAIIGAAGGGGANTGIAGTNGGNSSLTNGTITVTAGGGVAGSGGGVGGGGGGSATNGDLNIVGGVGSAPVFTNSGGTISYGPPGGGAPVTGAAASGFGTGNGLAGKAPGGGGNGGAGGSAGAFTGGAGAIGAVYIWG